MRHFPWAVRRPRPCCSASVSHCSVRLPRPAAANPAVLRNRRRSRRRLQPDLLVQRQPTLTTWQIPCSPSTTPGFREVSISPVRYLQHGDVCHRAHVIAVADPCRHRSRRCPRQAARHARHAQSLCRAAGLSAPGAAPYNPQVPPPTPSGPTIRITWSQLPNSPRLMASKP